MFSSQLLAIWPAARLLSPNFGQSNFFFSHCSKHTWLLFPNIPKGAVLGAYVQLEEAKNEGILDFVSLLILFI
jgi:hypothetical protein